MPKTEFSTKLVQHSHCQRTLVLLFLLYFAGLSQSCIHDSLDHKYVSGHQDYDDKHPFLVSERKRRLHSNEAEDIVFAEVNQVLSSSTFQPIRITPHYDYSSLNRLPDATRPVVFKIVAEAVQRISKALQVVPVTGNLFAHRFCTSYYQFTNAPRVCHSIIANETCLEMPIPDDHFASLKYYENCTSSGCAKDVYTLSPAGIGIPDTDFLIYVRAENTSNCMSGRTLAYASTCQQDQFDRPTFGMVNFCPSKLSTAVSNFERQVSTALHEFSHALGFSSRFFPLMRSEDGTPRTPRDQTGSPPVFTKGTCPNGKAIDYYVQPANTTIRYDTERNEVVAKMVTPRVRAFVQEHFNCSTLEGAEVESQDSGCLGSHWEERLFEPEYMTPVDSYRNVFSALTLAFFEDSGWYRANASTAQRMHFGRRQGCQFATEKCVDPATQVPLAADHFCTQNVVESCSVDAMSRSICSLSTIAQSIPTEYQYFPGNSTKGGSNTFADFCPINAAFSTGDYTVPTNFQKVGTTSINMFGETYCPTCKCTATTLRSTDSKGWQPSLRRQTGCYAMRCIVAEDAVTNATGVVLEITLPRSSTQDSTSLNCTRKGEKLSVAGFTGDITCPDPFVVCEVDDPSTFVLADTTSYSINGSAPTVDNGNGSTPAIGNGSTPTFGDVSEDGSGNSVGSSSSDNTTRSGTITTRTTVSGVNNHHTAVLALLGVAWLVIVITL